MRRLWQLPRSRRKKAGKNPSKQPNDKFARGASNGPPQDGAGH